jgi:hypothetical protein
MPPASGSIKADYETTANTPIRLGEALPANHLARFVVDVVSQLDLMPIYQKYKAGGGGVALQ